MTEAEAAFWVSIINANIWYAASHCTEKHKVGAMLLGSMWVLLAIGIRFFA